MLSTVRTPCAELLRSLLKEYLIFLSDERSPGIGLVKLMGRHSGYIAMFSTLASRDVDVCLIPEVKFVLEGPNVMHTSKQLLRQRRVGNPTGAEVNSFLLFVLFRSFATSETGIVRVFGEALAPEGARGYRCC